MPEPPAMRPSTLYGVFWPFLEKVESAPSTCATGRPVRGWSTAVLKTYSPRGPLNCIVSPTESFSMCIVSSPPLGKRGSSGK
jgi:hypothetical protein